MTYYRVKPKFDQRKRFKKSKFEHRRIPDGIYVANELYTKGELKDFQLPYEDEENIFEEVRIPKNKTYWFFGCRFEAIE